VQNVVMAQSSSPSALVNREKLAALQQSCSLVEAEEIWWRLLDRRAAGGEGVAAGAQLPVDPEGAGGEGYVRPLAASVAAQCEEREQLRVRPLILPRYSVLNES